MNHSIGKVLVCVAIVIAFSVPCASTVASSQDSDLPAEKEWTLLIYWDADNNLEFCTDFALETWRNAMTPDANINLVAMVDILSAEGTWIYNIHDGVADIVEKMPEQNMSDAAVLEEFVFYGLSNYPAEKTLLVMQDHGYSWRGLCVDETDGGGIMSIDAMVKAISAATARNEGRGVDVLAMDACSMATIEIAYELRGVVSFFVASQSVVPYDGLPYDMMVSSLASDASVSAERYSSMIVDQYIEYYSSKTDYEHLYPYDQDVITCSAFNISLIDELGEQFTKMTAALEPLVASHADEIKEARDIAVQGKWANIGGWEYLADVYTLFEELKGVDAGLDDSITSFLDAFNAALVNEGNSPRFGEIPHGLVVHFPPSLALYNSESWKWAQQFVYHDIGLDLVDESSWVSCLMEYYFSAPGTQYCPNHLVTA
ncbi:MAG TPA: clostripain-related cysteine peptidase [Thermoplasmata archaeon]|nr:clostripain-related cysteine peptidase [Thermoplasmata archaeon]